MSVNHPLAEVAEQLEKIFDAIENQESLDKDNLDNILGGLDEDPYWVAGVQAHDQEEEFVIEMELVGINPDEIDVDVQSDCIVMSTMKSTSDEDDDDEEQPTYDNAASEEEGGDDDDDPQSFGEFSTEVPMPSNVDSSQVTADFEGDTLQIRLPKVQ
ncbi:MAG: Hsp20/alpha crystallin family protein [Vampirovibrio sp.]|nr:Hsp20/alpha crystallin family protein [Vampirovibrio sp.]